MSNHYYYMKLYMGKKKESNKRANENEVFYKKATWA